MENESTAQRHDAETEAKHPGSNISSVEWIFVFLITISVDLTQFGLAFIPPLAVIVAPLLDIAFFLSLVFYLYYRGVNLDTKKVISMAASFAGELIPEVDALPLWTMDVAQIYFWDKTERLAAENPILSKVAKTAMALRSANKGLNSDAINPQESAKQSTPEVKTGGKKVDSLYKSKVSSENKENNPQNGKQAENDEKRPEENAEKMQNTADMLRLRQDMHDLEKQILELETKYEIEKRNIDQYRELISKKIKELKANESDPNNNELFELEHKYLRGIPGNKEIEYSRTIQAKKIQLENVKMQIKTISNRQRQAAA